MGASAFRTRAQILTAAEDLFARRGYAATRLEDIADVVGVRRSSVVYYFAGKREIYAAVLKQLFEELLDRLNHALVQQGPLEERIEGVVCAWIDFVTQRPSVANMILRELAGADRKLRRVVVEHSAPVLALFEGMIAEGVAAGTLRPIDPLRVMGSLAGSTLFQACIMPQFADLESPKPLDAEQLREHREETLWMARRLLGTRGPRPVPAKRQRDARKR